MGFVEHLCNCSPKMRTKEFKNYISILTIANYRNWLMMNWLMHLHSPITRKRDGGVILWTNPNPLRSWLFSKFSGWPLTSSYVNLLLVRSHQGEIFNVKRLINNVTRVRVESRSCNHGRRKNDALTLSVTRPTRCFTLLKFLVSNRRAPYCGRPRGGLRDNGARDR